MTAPAQATASSSSLEALAPALHDALKHTDTALASLQQFQTVRQVLSTLTDSIDAQHHHQAVQRLQAEIDKLTAQYRHEQDQWSADKAAIDNEIAVMQRQERELHEEVQAAQSERDRVQTQVSAVQAEEEAAVRRLQARNSARDLTLLPRNALESVSSFLRPLDVLNARTVCQRWATTLEKGSVWRVQTMKLVHALLLEMDEQRRFGETANPSRLAFAIHFTPQQVNIQRTGKGPLNKAEIFQFAQAQLQSQVDKTMKEFEGWSLQSGSESNMKGFLRAQLDKTRDETGRMSVETARLEEGMKTLAKEKAEFARKTTELEKKVRAEAEARQALKDRHAEQMKALDTKIQMIRNMESFAELAATDSEKAAKRSNQEEIAQLQAKKKMLVKAVKEMQKALVEVQRESDELQSRVNELRSKVQAVV